MSERSVEIAMPRPAMDEAARAGLTPELEAAAARRLGSLALVVAMLTAALGTLEVFVGAPSALQPLTRIGLVALTLSLSLGLDAAIIRGAVGAARALALAPAYQVAQGLLIAVLFHATAVAPAVEVRGWTPVAVWMAVFPLVVPARSRRVVAATIATAVMDPLGLWVSVAAGAPWPEIPALASLFLPTVAACAVAPMSAAIVYGLTAEVRRAREMGSYRLVEKLGQGGMGDVWRAEHRMLARGAAIKLIRPAALGGADAGQAREMIRRFEREARATAALRSPHTIAVYDYGVAEDGTFHYVMELLEGFSLQELVERFGPVPPERAVRMLRQACHSLAEAHAAGLVHRDVKPANLFVCRLGLDVDFVKVLDFGLVRMHGALAPGADGANADGGFTGTPGFLPPEVALAAPAIDGRADIYALGAVAYWLLTGQRVFEGDSAMQMVLDHVRTPPVPPSRRATQAIPEALEWIVLRCLEKDPAHRPASATELSRELQCLDIEGRWTEERAREWWHARDVDRRLREAAAALHPSPTAETRSMPPIHFKALLQAGAVGPRAARTAFRRGA